MTENQCKKYQWQIPEEKKEESLQFARKFIRINFGFVYICQNGKHTLEQLVYVFCLLQIQCI